MLDTLILFLFLISGAATGWLGVDLLPEPLLLQVNNLEGLRWVLGGFGAFFGLVAGIFFGQLRRRLMAQVRSMPTDLLVSRAVGLILGLLVANLLLAPILLLPLPWEVVLVKPLAAVLSNVFFGVSGYNLPRCTAAPCCGCSTPPAPRPCWWRTGCCSRPPPRSSTPA